MAIFLSGEIACRAGGLAETARIHKGQQCRCADMREQVRTYTDAVWAPLDSEKTYRLQYLVAKGAILRYVTDFDPHGVRCCSAHSLSILRKGQRVKTKVRIRQFPIFFFYFTYLALVLQVFRDAARSVSVIAR